MTVSILEKVNNPKDLHDLSAKELKQLAEEIRDYIIHSVSQTGGHLASNLGVVDLSIAMHYVFDFKKDHLLWDVGHQCYSHKILTGRKHLFHRLRKRDGLSGFPSPEESPYDRFSVGHAGTALSTALGMALGSQLNKTDEKIVALIGDASIVNGASFEALNNLGLVKRQLLIILNDNSMAIDVTQGAIAKFLAKVRLNHNYEDLRKRTSNILQHLPLIGKSMDHALESFKKTLRMAMTPSKLFESMDIPYFGPVDGHDIPSLIELFQEITHLNTPAILHVYTKKGKGFTPAGDNPRKYHSTGPFEIEGRQTNHAKGVRTFTESFSDSITQLAERDDRIVAITAAMPDGTGLIKFREKFPDRYYDVGIAESVAVDIAAGMAAQGKKPFVCIYSTFLQRSFDQIFQEVSLQNLPIVFCIDRAGFVGNDGPTHHGLLDIGYLRCLPNLTLLAPACESELHQAMAFAANHTGPVAIRYPKDQSQPGILESDVLKQPFILGESLPVIKKPESPIIIASVGSLLSEALQAEAMLSKEGMDVGVVNVRFVKPIDPALLNYIKQGKDILVIEDHSRACGFGSALLEATHEMMFNQADEQVLNQMGRVFVQAVPDRFVKADKRSNQLAEVGLSAEGIVDTVKKIKKNLYKPHVEDIC